MFSIAEQQLLNPLKRSTNPRELQMILSLSPVSPMTMTSPVVSRKKVMASMIEPFYSRLAWVKDLAPSVSLKRYSRDRPEKMPSLLPCAISGAEIVLITQVILSGSISFPVFSYSFQTMMWKTASRACLQRVTECSLATQMFLRWKRMLVTGSFTLMGPKEVILRSITDLSVTMRWQISKLPSKKPTASMTSRFWVCSDLMVRVRRVRQVISKTCEQGILNLRWQRRQPSSKLTKATKHLLLQMRQQCFRLSYSQISRQVMRCFQCSSMSSFQCWAMVSTRERVGGGDSRKIWFFLLINNNWHI